MKQFEESKRFTKVVGILAPTPGCEAGDSGHVATKMMVEAFQEQHFRIVIFTRDTFTLTFRSSNVTLHKFHKPLAETCFPLRILGMVIYQLHIGVSIIRHYKELDFLIVGGWALVIPLVFCKIFGIKSIQRIGGHPMQVLKGRIDSENPFCKIRLALAKLAMQVDYQIVDRIAVITPSLVKYLNLEPYKTKVIVWDHYSFDLEKFKPTIQFGARDQTVGFIGVFNKDKGVPELVKSAIEVCQLKSDINFLFIGRGPYLPEAKVKVREAGLEDRVQLTGYVSRGNLPTYLNKMSLFVLPTRHEGLPKVILEAMACGTPVLATPVGGIPDIIEDGINGFLSDNLDTSRLLTEKMRSIFENEDLLMISKRAREFVLKRYNPEAVRDRYKKMVSTLIDNSPGKVSSEKSGRNARSTEGNDEIN